MRFLRENSGSVTLACFSPPVMLVTFIIELLLALYTALTQRGIIMRISVLLMLCLAAFQISEYSVCEGDPAVKLIWTKFGLICISFLPALGVHLAARLTKYTALVKLGYVLAFLFSVAFLMVPSASAAGYCLGNYVLIAMPNSGLSNLYMWYYFGFIIIGILQLMWGMLIDSKASKALYWARVWFIIGYLSFTVPMAVWAFVQPSVKAGTPSIMCGFALALAIIVALRVVPLSSKRK